jgi:site-specific recombinase XerD
MQPPSGSTLSSPLARLIEATLHHMRGLGYSPQYMALCHGVWKSFVSFTSQVSGNETFSAPLVAPFLASRGITEPTSSGLSSRQCLIRASMRMLTDFHFHGCSQRCRHTRQRVSLPPLLHHSLQQYETFCHDHLRCSLKTMRTRMRHLTQFLHFLDAHAVSTCAAIEPKHLSAFICSQVHLIPKTLAGVVSNLRSFFRFLCMQNLIADDLRPHLPKIRIPRHAQIPSVWRPEDVVALLAAVDRSSPKGKRDYAILLLACRLGLRVSDIRTLRLEHIRWDQAVIERCQGKTGEPVTLPLSEEVGQALIDYLQHGRPETPYREIFLRLKAPLEPFGENDNLHHIITFYRKRAGITLPAQKLQGLHSLRHTMATRLLEVGTPFETIAAVLGHRSLESTRIYTKVALEALRSAALEVEETCHV